MVSFPDAAALKKHGIRTVEELWKCIGDKVGAGLTKVSEETQVSKDALIEVLCAQSVAKAEHRYTRGMERNWPQAGAIAVALILLLLLARASFALPWPDPPLALRDRVLLASRDLAAGHVLRADDVHTVLMSPQPDMFSPVNLDGMVLAKNVRLGQPLRFGDVLRPQLIAVQNLSAEEIVARDAISLTWSSYQPDAVTRVTEALGRRLRYGLKDGQLVETHFLAEQPSWITQVTLTTALTSSYFHLVAPADLSIKDASPPVSATVTPPMEKHFISRGDLTGRQIVWLTITHTEPTLLPPLRASLLVSPHLTGTKNSPTILIKNAIVLSLTDTGSGHAALVALRPDDLPNALPSIADADVYILDTFP